MAFLKLKAVLLFLVLFFSLNVVGEWCHVGYKEDVNVTKSLNQSVNASLGLEDSALIPHIAWVENAFPDSDIEYTLWNDTETKWVTPTVPSGSTKFAENPSLALDSINNPNVAWSHIETNNNKVLYSKFDGSNWSTSERVDDTTNPAVLRKNPQLDINTGMFPHITWAQPSGSISYFYHKYRTLVGSWTSLIGGNSKLTETSNGSRTSLDFDSVYGYPFVAFDGIDFIFFEGGVWKSKETPYFFPGAGGGYNSSLKIGSGNARKVVYENSLWPYNIRFAFWNGTDWTKMDVPNSNNGKNPSLALDYPSNNVHIAWELNGEIFYSKFDGTNWVINKLNISNDAGVSSKPSLFINDAGDIGVAWHDNTGGNDDIYFKFWAESCPKIIVENILTLLELKTTKKQFQIEEPIEATATIENVLGEGHMVTARINYQLLDSETKAPIGSIQQTNPIDISAGGIQEISFSIPTTGLNEGSYLVSAEAVTYDYTESDLADNSKTVSIALLPAPQTVAVPENPIVLILLVLIGVFAVLSFKK